MYTHTHAHSQTHTPRTQNKCQLDQTTHESRCRIENGWGALHFAADQGHLHIVKYLIEHGANVDLRNANNETACALAAEFGHQDLVRYLVHAGSDVHAVRRELNLVQWAIYR